jgi:molecular chaperone GrpE (heat shock protein)
MSTGKWMTGLVSLFVLAVGPVALAEESGATSGDVQAPAAVPASVDDASKDREEQQIQELQAEIKELRAEVAASAAEGRQYLDQNPQPWR